MRTGTHQWLKCSTQIPICTSHSSDHDLVARWGCTCGCETCCCLVQWVMPSGQCTYLVQFTCQWILRFSDWGGWIAMEVLAEPVNPSSGGLPPTLGISQSWIYRDWVIIETWLSFHELNESWSNRLVGFPFMILQRSHLNMHVTCDLWPLGTALILQTTNQDGWTIFEFPLVGKQSLKSHLWCSLLHIWYIWPLYMYLYHAWFHRMILCEPQGITYYDI